MNREASSGLPRKIATGRKKREGGEELQGVFFSGGSQTPGEGKELWEEGKRGMNSIGPWIYFIDI